MRNIFIACDTSSPQNVNRIIKQSQIKLKGYRIGYKFGLEFFYSKNGRKFIENLKVKNLWLDIKTFDNKLDFDRAKLTNRSLSPRLTKEEEKLHQEFIESLGPNSIWKRISSN